jgi:hypothetical protein
MFEKLLNIIDQRSVVEEMIQKKRHEFEESMSVQFAQLEDLKEKEILLREEALLALDKENKDSVVVDNRTIYRQVKETRSIRDVAQFVNAIKDRKAELLQAGIITPENENTRLYDLEMVITDKKYADHLISGYNKLTGNDLSGVNVKRTRYITVRNKE